MNTKFEAYKLGKVKIPEVVLGLERITELERLASALIREEGFTSPVLVTNRGEFILNHIYTTDERGQIEYDKTGVKNVSFLAHPDVAEVVARQEGWFYFAPGEVQDCGDEKGRSIRKISGTAFLGAVDAIVKNAVECAKFEAAGARYSFEKEEKENFAEVQRQTGKSLRGLLGFFANPEKIKLEGKVGDSDFYIVGTPKLIPELPYQFDTSLSLELGRPGSNKHASPLAITNVKFAQDIILGVAVGNVNFDKRQVEEVLDATRTLAEKKYHVSDAQKRAANLQLYCHAEYKDRRVLLEGVFHYHNRDLGGIPAEGMRYLRNTRDMFRVFSSATYTGLSLLAKQEKSESEKRIRGLKRNIAQSLARKSGKK